MKGCENSGLLPCSRDGYGVFHHLDDTRDKVYELNKQMCDIGKTILTKNKDIMEEKKTKKMTKAEAFEWLKHKKVYVGGNSAVIQEKLFEAGFEWAENKRNISNLEQPFLILSEGGGIFCSNNMCHYLERSHEEISADDILSIEIVEECAKDDEDPYFGGRIKDLQEMLEDDEVLIITKTNFLTMTK